MCKWQKATTDTSARSVIFCVSDVKIKVTLTVVINDFC